MDKQYPFTTTICGAAKSFVITVPIVGDELLISLYRPANYATSNPNLISESDFIVICQKFAALLSCLNKAETHLDALIGSLMGVVTEEIRIHGRISFSELLTFMDCFALFLSTDSIAVDKVIIFYETTLNTIIEMFRDRLVSK